MTGEYMYFQFFHDFPSIVLLKITNQLVGVNESVGELWEWKLLLLWVDFIFFLFYLRFIQKKQFEKTKRVFYVHILIIPVILITMVVRFIVVDMGTGNYVFSVNRQSNVQTYYEAGLLGYHLVDAGEVFKQTLNASLSKEEKKEMDLWYQKQNKQRKISQTKGVAKNSNVIIIQLESIENFLIDSTINGQEVTPHMNQLKKEMDYFSNNHQQIFKGGTSDAEFVALSSLHPYSKGSSYVFYGHKKFDTLPTILRENGYQTMAFHGYTKHFWNRYNAYPNLGIDNFFHKDHYVIDDKVGFFLSDRSFYTQSFAKIKTTNDPFFAFLVASTSHYPFKIDSSHKVLNVGEYEGTIKGDYLHSVHYVDETVGDLVKFLKKEGYWDRSIVVIYGDHYARIDFDEKFAKDIGKPMNEYELEIENRQVPLFIHYPNNEPQQIETPKGMIDLAPTILELLDYPYNKTTMVGESLYTDKNNIVFSDKSYIAGDTYFKRTLGNEICYDRIKGIKIDKKYCVWYKEDADKELHINENVIIKNY